MTRIKDLLPLSKTLTVLYVEDDVNIRENYSTIFKEVFKSMDACADGQEGLDTYKSGSYDIVVTDINMPRMNGIEMIRNIYEINEEQIVIVTSAHDEARYLIELIDLGVSKFLVKPIDIAKLMNILLRTCKRIQETKELYEYQRHIEEESLSAAALLNELQRKNGELEKEIQKKTQKENVTLTFSNGIEKEKTFTKEQLNFYTPHLNKISALDFITGFTGDADTLSDRLEGVEETLELTIHQKLSNPTPKGVKQLATSFSDYALHLDSTLKYSNLAQALRHLSSVLLQVEHLEILSDMKPFLFGIADSLQRVRMDVLVHKTAEDIHFLDQSIISDCLQTESMLISDTPAEDDLDDLFF